MRGRGGHGRRGEQRLCRWCENPFSHKSVEPLVRESVLAPSLLESFPATRRNGLLPEPVFEVQRRHVERDAGLIREKMEQAIKLDVPIVVDVAWAPTWAEAK